jgi:hypothetical protein
LLEQQRQDELEAIGMAEVDRSEDMEAQIAAARAAGDQILTYKLIQRQKEMKINEEYNKKLKDAETKAAAEQKAIEEQKAAEEKSIEEQLARDKAELEYKSAVQKYALDMVNAVNAGIMAVLLALATTPPANLALAGIASALTAAQIGLLAANPPRPPAFADGGIVPGVSYTGDNIPIMANSGELILNQAQQDNLAGKLTGTNNDVTIVMELDGVEIARNTFDIAERNLIRIPVKLFR